MIGLVLNIVNGSFLQINIPALIPRNLFLKKVFCHLSRYCSWEHILGAKMCKLEI